MAANVKMAAAAAVPVEAREIVKSLKEIVVNLSELEIYNMLNECDMDADETVQRMLSQDTFQKVTSKRERRKEVKEKPVSKPRSISSSSNRGVKNGTPESFSHPHEVSHPQNPISNVDEINNEPSSHSTVGQSFQHEDWSAIEQSRATSSASDNENGSDLSSSHSSRSHLSSQGHSDNLFQTLDNILDNKRSTEYTGSTFESNRQQIIEPVLNSSHLGSDSLKDTSYCQPQKHPFVTQKAVSSTVANIQRLSLSNEVTKLVPVDDNFDVKIPNHLQVSPADFSHLSFGTFKPDNMLESSGPIKSDLKEVASAAINLSLPSNLDTRTLEYKYPPEVNVDGHVYDFTKTSQSELKKPIVSESALSQQDLLPSTLYNYDIEKRQQLNFPTSYVQSKPTDASAFSSRMGLDADAFSIPRPNYGTGIVPSPASQHNFAMKPDDISSLYSQAGRSFEEPSSKMYGYTNLPQNHAHLQSQVALESAARAKYTLPQYKSSASVSSFPESAINSSGYGNFGVSSHTESFLQKPSGTHAYNGMLKSLYGDGNQYNHPQQNESPSQLAYGHGLRMQPSVRSNLFHDMHGQNQQLAGFRQAQQSMQQQHQQHQGGQDYSNFLLHQQSRFPRDQLQRRNVDLIFNGTASPSAPSQQIWPYKYSP